MLGVEAEAIERWEEQDAPSPNTARARLARLGEIAELGRVVYGEDGFKLSKSNPLPELGGKTPLQTLEAGEHNRVVGVLAGDYESLVSST